MRRYVLATLEGGDRRSIGKSPAVVRRVLRRPELTAHLVRGLRDADPIGRMRAADALEKLSAIEPQRLRRLKRSLLPLVVTGDQQGVQWHLARMVPRLPLTTGERTRLSRAFEGYLRAASSIVRAEATQALAVPAPRSRGCGGIASAAMRSTAREGEPGAAQDMGGVDVGPAVHASARGSSTRSPQTTRGHAFTTPPLENGATVGRHSLEGASANRPRGGCQADPIPSGAPARCARRRAARHGAADRAIVREGRVGAGPFNDPAVAGPAAFC